MDTERKHRLFKELKRVYNDAQREVSMMAPGDWDEMRAMTLEEMSMRMTRMSTVSHEYYQLRAAMALLYPYRIAWKILKSYSREIIEATETEQRDILARILDIMCETTQADPDTIQKHVYAFWPIREQAGAEV